MDIDEQNAVALMLAREWQQAIAALATDTAECLETVVSIALKPELKGHPFYWGKMSILRTFKEFADEDAKRFETPGAAKLLAELEAARAVVKAARAWATHPTTLLPIDKDDLRVSGAVLSALVAYDAITKAAQP
jgi:hypothetical protein